MSDNSNEDNNDDICRDFLRNVCRRGKRCKYRHPSSDEAKVVVKQEYTFCHDYQNAGCTRPTCKYMHCTREEEDYYKSTGQLPVRIHQAAAHGGVGSPSNDLPVLKGEIPICKDHLRGDCKRGVKCKFRHLSATEYMYELRRIERLTRHEDRDRDRDRFGSYNDDLDRLPDRFGDFDSLSVGMKRRRLDEPRDEFNGFHGTPDRIDRFGPTSPYQELYEENAMLRRKIEELKKQVSDLSATNEVLLDQNARMRASKANSLINSTPALVNVTPAMTPTVTMTPAVTLGGTHTASAQQALSALTATLSQQIALNSQLASEQALQQRLAQELATPNSNLGAALLNTPAVNNLNNPGMVPVSLGQGSLSQDVVPSVSLAVSLPQNLGASASMAQNMTQNMAAVTRMSGPNSGMVSYPVASQGLRSVGDFPQRSLAH